MVVQRIAITFPVKARDKFDKFYAKIANKKYKTGIEHLLKDMMSEKMRDTGADVSGNVSIEMNQKDKQIIITYTIDGELPRHLSTQIKNGLLDMLNRSTRLLTTEFEFNKKRLNIFGDDKNIDKFFKEFESRLKTLLGRRIAGDTYIKTTVRSLKNGLELSIDSDREDVIRVINEFATDEFITNFINDFINQLETSRARAQEQLLLNMSSSNTKPTPNRKPKKKKSSSRSSLPPTGGSAQSQTRLPQNQTRHTKGSLLVQYDIEDLIRIVRDIFPRIKSEVIQQAIRDLYAQYGADTNLVERVVEEILPKSQLMLVDRGQNNLNLLGAPTSVLTYIDNARKADATVKDSKSPVRGEQVVSVTGNSTVSLEEYILMLKHYIRILEDVISRNNTKSRRPAQALPPYKYQARLKEYVDEILRPNVNDARWWSIYLIKARASLDRLLL